MPITISNNKCIQKFNNYPNRHNKPGNKIIILQREMLRAFATAENEDGIYLIQLSFITFGFAFFIGFLNFNTPLPISGWLSPSKNPYGASGSILSNITLMMAVSGMARNMPDTPHNAPPISTTMMETSALIFTLLATILGTKKLLSMNCTMM